MKAATREPGSSWRQIPISPRILRIYISKIFYFITGLPEDQQYAGIIPEDDLRAVPTGSYQIFEPVLDRDYSLRPEEIDPDGMASSLKDTTDLVSQYLKRQLSIDVQKMIDSYRGPGSSIEHFQSALVKI